MEPLIIFGSMGVGEIVQYSSLIYHMSLSRDVTLVLANWQVPVFEGRFKVISYNDDQAYIKKDGRGRRIILDESFAKKLGLPGIEWMFPLGDDVIVNNAPVPGKIERRYIVQSQQCLGEKLLNEYGIESPDFSYYITPNEEYGDIPTIAFGNSAEKLRMLPTSLMVDIMKRFQGMRFSFVGFPYVEAALRTPYNICDYHWTYEVNAETTRDCLKAVQRADLIIGSDCGWAFIGLGSGKKAMVLQSRAPVESLVPQSYWGTSFLVDKLTTPACDKQCWAQKLIEQVGGDDNLNPQWFDPKKQTPEWSKNVFASPYPQTLACYKNKEPVPCLQYAPADIDRLIEKILILKPQFRPFLV